MISFNDNEEEIIESVLAALGTGRNIYCDENNIKPLKIHYGDIVILLDKRELFRKQEKIDLSFIEFEILHLLMRSPGRVFSKEQIYDDLRVKISLYGKSADLNQLDHHRQARNRTLILNVGKILPFNPNHFCQCFSCQTLCLSCGFDICTEGFKTGTIFNFRHITSPGYIV